MTQLVSEARDDANLPQRIVFQDSFDPPGDGKPKDTSSAGSRGRCSPDAQPIQPLMPKQNYGLTLEERPSIFINIPKTSAQQVVLAFQDQAETSSERAVIPITDHAGIVSFSLPAQKLPLVVGKNYRWLLAIVCGKTLQPDDPVLIGWVQRVARTSEWEKELGQKSAIEQAMWYGAKGYWYDLLKVMVQARRSHPNDVKLNTLWQDLLRSVGLSAIASEPLLLGD